MPSAEDHKAAALEASAQGDHRAALAHWTQAIALEPRNVKLRIRRATTYMDTGRLSDAATDAQHACSLDPSDDNAFHLLS